MKKSEWFLVIFPLCFVWIIDHITKRWALGLTGAYDYQFLTVVLHFNRGVMLGMFSDLPEVLRVVSLSTGGAFLLCVYSVIQYMLPIKSIKLRIGMSLLIGGILGNVTDRIIWGHVVDFLVLKGFGFSTAVFNVADFLQWFGYALIVIAIVRDAEILWPENNHRKNIWINPQYQLRYSMFIVGVGMGIAIIGAVFSYTYLRVTILDIIGSNHKLADKFLAPFVYTYIGLVGIFSIILFIVGKNLSHRSAGPIYAFEKYMADLLAGKKRKFKLRTSDDFKNLESLAEQLAPYIEKSQDSSAHLTNQDSSALKGDF